MDSAGVECVPAILSHLVPLFIIPSCYPPILNALLPWSGSASPMWLSVRSRRIESYLLLASALLAVLLQIIYLIRVVPTIVLSDHINNANQNVLFSQQNHGIFESSSASAPNILLAGIAYSDDTISDVAIKYLIQAACDHQIKSHILISKRNENASMNKKVYMMTQHMYVPLAQGGTRRQPNCASLIKIKTAPDQMQLINATRIRMTETGEIQSLQKDYHGYTEKAPNSPLDGLNRIAKIKRVREHQRQQVKHGEALKMKNLKEFVVGVIDLDMFDYPALSKVINISETYMLHSLNNKGATRYTTICSNGLQRSRYWEPFPQRNYYDTFATLLLPNTWPVLESNRVVPRGELERENVTMAKISQQELLNWFLREGSKGNDVYVPVPVRSCFGGLTLYRADAWLHPRCRYDTYDKRVDVYRGKKEQHTCEHIVFHECLRREYKEVSIAVQPDMVTLWHLV